MTSRSQLREFRLSTSLTSSFVICLRFRHLPRCSFSGVICSAMQWRCVRQEQLIIKKETYSSAYKMIVIWWIFCDKCWLTCFVYEMITILCLLLAVSFVFVVLCFNFVYLLLKSIFCLLTYFCLFVHLFSLLAFSRCMCVSRPCLTLPRLLTNPLQFIAILCAVVYVCCVCVYVLAVCLCFVSVWICVCVCLFDWVCVCVCLSVCLSVCLCLCGRSRLGFYGRLSALNLAFILRLRFSTSCLTLIIYWQSNVQHFQYIPFILSFPWPPLKLHLSAHASCTHPFFGTCACLIEHIFLSI